MFKLGKDRYALGLITLLAGIGLYFGWRLYWFLTDDAYIAFRYVSNSVLGYGYVWNAPPFLSVEGYTSFLRVVILDGAWRIWIIALVQLGVVTNRSFLTWASSGLESALFNFLVLAWLFVVFNKRGNRWAPSLAGTAA